MTPAATALVKLLTQARVKNPLEFFALVLKITVGILLCAAPLPQQARLAFIFTGIFVALVLTGIVTVLAVRYPHALTGGRRETRHPPRRLKPQQQPRKASQTP
jgi:high-affinity K+ transport system ATPase subunit B